MPTFTRAFVPGGMFFFTVVTYRRRPVFRSGTARDRLHRSIATVQTLRPFTIDAIVLLPDHLHCIWTLPGEDPDFSTRWRKIKEGFTRAHLASAAKECPVTPGQAHKGLRGVWQPRFWEHAIRDEHDFPRHVDYIHFNPVKHGHVSCPHAWAWSSFARWVAAGVYERDWCCECRGRRRPIPEFDDLAEMVGE